MKNRLLMAVGSFFFITAALAQAKQPAACGPDNVKFDTHKGQQPAILQAGSDNAVLYVITELRYGGIVVGCQANTRVGVDGKWLGANCGSSYLSVNLTPGEHHLCVDLRKDAFSDQSPRALGSFVAEPGKTYYYHAIAWKLPGVESLDLNQVDGDEGNFLLSMMPASMSKPKD